MKRNPRYKGFIIGICAAAVVVIAGIILYMFVVVPYMQKVKVFKAIRNRISSDALFNDLAENGEVYLNAELKTDLIDANGLICYDYENIRVVLPDLSDTVFEYKTGIAGNLSGISSVEAAALVKKAKLSKNENGEYGIDIFDNRLTAVLDGDSLQSISFYTDSGTIRADFSDGPSQDVTTKIYKDGDIVIERLSHNDGSEEGTVYLKGLEIPYEASVIDEEDTDAFDGEVLDITNASADDIADELIKIIGSRLLF